MIKRKELNRALGRTVLLVVLLLVIFSMAIALSPVSLSQTRTPDPCGTLQWDEWFAAKTTSAQRQCLYTFNGSAGKYVSIVMERNERAPQLDPYLELKDTYGRVVAADDDSYDKNGNSWIDSYRLPQTGKYTVVARSYQDKTFGEFWLYLSQQ